MKSASPEIQIWGSNPNPLPCFSNSICVYEHIHSSCIHTSHFLYGWHYTSLLRYLLTYFIWPWDRVYIPLLTAFTTPTFGTGLSPSLCFIVFPLYLSVLIAYCSDPLLALAFAAFSSCTIQPILIAALFCCCFCFAGYVPAWLDWLIQWNNSTLDTMHEPSLTLIIKSYWFSICVL